MSDDQQRRQRALAFLQNIELDPADNDAHKAEEISAAEIKSPMSPIANDADYNDEPLRKLSGNFPDMPERTRIALSFLTSLSDPNWQEHIENNTVAFAAQNNAPIDMPESRFSSPIAVNSSQLTSPSTAVNPAITTDGRTTIITAPLEESVKDVDEVVRPLTRSPRNSMTGSQSRLLPEAGTAESSAEALEQSASNVLSTSLPRENTGPSRRLMSISKVKHRRRRRDSVLVVKVHHNRPYSFAAIPRDARIFFTAGPNVRCHSSYRLLIVFSSTRWQCFQSFAIGIVERARLLHRVTRWLPWIRSENVRPLSLLLTFLILRRLGHTIPMRSMIPISRQVDTRLLLHFPPIWSPLSNMLARLT